MWKLLFVSTKHTTQEIEKMKKKKLYQTPRGSVFAKNMTDAAVKMNVPVESVYTLTSGYNGIPPRVAQYY